ncbi:MAG: hypothetical protein H9789_05300 [Candidatus Paraprevotella stercoravium]|uniref:Transmembrane protein n=1 Tax=Candidatus Paraprevotella stercoravium TaxID=2838725 RepID=A0A9E2L7Y7_9BACT|nr:hypothetical protein [Candidatus Paraprevotella stercoravium]
MRNNRFQNKVATSGFTLPVAALVATLLWAAIGPMSQTKVYCWLCCALCSYLLVEFNNANALLRIRSRLTTSTFLLGIGCFSFLHESLEALSVTFFVLGCYYFLFRSYQESNSSPNIYHAFVSLGIASLIHPLLLCFIPFVYWSMIAYLRSFSFKTFCASLLGILTPFWFYGAYLIYIQDYTQLINVLQEFTSYSLPAWNEYLSMDITRLSAFLWILILGMISTIHTLKTSYNDKIRTRMQFYTLILFEAVILIFLLLQPQHFDLFMALLTLTSAPVIAHFFALTSYRITNLLFIFSIFIYLLIAFSSLWINYLPLLQIF